MRRYWLSFFKFLCLDQELRRGRVSNLPIQIIICSGFQAADHFQVPNRSLKGKEPPSHFKIHRKRVSHKEHNQNYKKTLTEIGLRAVVGVLHADRVKASIEQL